MLLVTVLIAFSGCGKSSDSDNDTDSKEGKSSLSLNYSLDEFEGSLTKESVSGKDYTINYVFNEQNADSLFKEPTIII